MLFQNIEFKKFWSLSKLRRTKTFINDPVILDWIHLKNSFWFLACMKSSLNAPSKNRYVLRQMTRLRVGLGTILHDNPAYSAESHVRYFVAFIDLVSLLFDKAQNFCPFTLDSCNVISLFTFLRVFNTSYLPIRSTALRTNIVWKRWWPSIAYRKFTFPQINKTYNGHLSPQIFTRLFARSQTIFSSQLRATALYTKQATATMLPCFIEHWKNSRRLHGTHDLRKEILLVWF